MKRGAVIDPTDKYRYSLTRVWNESKRKVTFIMLNPSTADAVHDDPATRRCIGFAQLWGYGSLEIVNLFAYRSTDPDQLKIVTDPVGPENDEYIMRAVVDSDIVLAWGDKVRSIPGYRYRHQQVINMLCNYNLHCFRLTVKGCPIYPLYLKGDSTLTQVKWIDNKLVV